MRIIKVAVDFIFISRPVLWIPVWGFALFGYWQGLSITGRRTGIFSISSGHLQPFLWMLVFSCAVGCVYVLNQLADYEVDKVNSGFALMAHGGISERAAWVSAAIFGSLSVIIPLLYKPAIALFSGAAIIIGILYSFKPFFLSGRPAADFITNAAGFGIVAFGAGWYCAGAQIGDVEFWKHAAPYFFLMCGGSISSTLPDITGDARQNKKTTAVALGPANAHLVAALCIALGALWAMAEHDSIALVCALGSLPLYIAYILHKTQALMEMTYKAGGAVCMLCAACLFPVFAGAAILVVAMTVLYFRLRFGIRYPSLLPAKAIKAG